MGEKKTRILIDRKYFRKSANGKYIESSFDDNRAKEYVRVRKSNGDIKRYFLYDKRISTIKNFDTQKRANEIAIRNYYQSRSSTTYEPTKQKSREYQKEFSMILEDTGKYRKNTKKFKKGSRLIFTNQLRLKRFDYMYIRVEVKVYFNGVWVKSYGRSDYVRSQITEGQRAFYVKQAIRRALGVYGSNLRYTLVRADNVYYRSKELVEELKRLA